MPYIKQEDKPKFEPALKTLAGVEINGPGELNYLVTRIALMYLEQNGLKYQHLNDVSGALTNANLELYRRLAGPYEDKKIAENGDVYPPKKVESVSNT